jgi:hypothetical protein
VRENDPSLVRPQTDLFLPDFSIQDLGLFVELLYRGEVALRTLRQAAPLRHLLRLLEIDLNLEASMMATVFLFFLFLCFFPVCLGHQKIFNMSSSSEFLGRNLNNKYKRLEPWTNEL